MAAFKIRLLLVGKTKEAWLEQAISDYTKRLSSDAYLESLYFKDDEALTKAANKEKRLFLLDPHGESMTSEAFSLLIEKELLNHCCGIAFAIGGPAGLPSHLKKGHPLISFSRMTFTHQCIRLLLVEQIYRAFQIIKKTPYHK